MKIKVSTLLLLLALTTSQGLAAENSPLVVIAQVKVKPGTEESFKASAEKIIGPTRHETGNLGYDFQQATDDPTEFATVEHWKSQADVDAHMKTPHMQSFFQEVGNEFEPGFPLITTYRKF